MIINLGKILGVFFMKKLISFLAFTMIASFVGASHPLIPVKSDTLLIKTVKNGNYKNVKRLLKSGNVFVNELGVEQKTAMDVAVEFGDSKIAILLSKYGGKITRADNSDAFKSMLKYRGKRYFISFCFMFLFAGLALWAFEACICAVEASLAYLALAIPAGVGIIVYSGYEWSRLFKGISMYSKAERSWMIDISDIA
jgi:hypothetical protein